MGRGSRGSVRWKADRQRKKKARDAKATPAVKAAGGRAPRKTSR